MRTRRGWLARSCLPARDRNTQSADTRRASACACAPLLWAGFLVTSLLPLQSASQTLPGGATPGGALPEVPTQRVVPEIPPADIFPIPPVIDRPLGVEEGERLFISGFRLKGVTDRPEQGIKVEEITELLEKARVEVQGLDQIGDDGFTETERSEIASFMKVVVNDADWDNRLADYEALVDRLREEKLDREVGMTIGQMQELANAVTQYYRNSGFILAQAFIPAQEVSEGTVTIEVLEGTLGNVLAEGNTTFSEKVLAAPFQELIDSPVTAGEIESSILTLTDLPGLSIFGVFQPGRRVGESDLVLKVQEEDPWEATFRYDNHGTRFTGDNRVFAEFTLNNPTRAGDRLTASILQQYNPKKSFFGSVEYERPILLPGLSVVGLYSRNFFDVGAELRPLNISGASKIGTAYARYAFVRTRENNIYAQIGVSRKQSVTKQDRNVVAKDALSMAQAEVSFDVINAETRSISLGTVGVTYGLDDWFGGMGGPGSVANNALPPSRITGTGKFASNKFQKVNAGFARLQNLRDNIQGLVRLEGQWSPSILTSLEQYHIGGPTNVRAYAPSEFLMDSAFFASVELTADAPGFADAASPFKNLNWGEILHVSFFTDYAMGSLHSPNATDEAAISVAGLGVGVALTVPGAFTGRVQAAHPTNSRVSTDGDPTHWWFDFSYTF